MSRAETDNATSTSATLPDTPVGADSHPPPATALRSDLGTESRVEADSKSALHRVPERIRLPWEQSGFDGLIAVMARLRADDGCPWDREQNLESLKPYLLEEAFEVLEVMDTPFGSLREELGDLLFQIVFQARIAEELQAFTVHDVADGIRRKMIRRHPHVFPPLAAARNASAQDAGDQSPGSPTTGEQVVTNWEQAKREERRKVNEKASVLDGIPSALPSLLQAWRMTEKASRVGFDWPSLEGVRAKLDEEIAELDEAIEGGNADEISHELGDVLFSLVNMSRFLGHNPEETLRKANLRFKARFQHMEQALHAEGLRPEQLDIDALEARWQAAKRSGL